MKKINYGNRSREKKPNSTNLDNLKEGDEVCGAIIDSYDPNFLSYISSLVEKTKTPSRKSKLKRVDEKEHRHHQRSPLHSKELSSNEQEIQNTTVPMNKFKNKSHQKGLSDKNQVMKISKMHKSSRVTKLSESVRYPTQECQLDKKTQKYDQTSLICSEEEEQYLITNKKFLSGIDQYLISLEYDKKNSLKSRRKRMEGDDIRNTDEILYENVRLRKKLKKYERIIDEQHEAAESHLKYCRKKQKSTKNLIAELTQQLDEAFMKISNQKQQISTMRTFFKTFGKKAQQYGQQYEEESSDMDEDFNDILLKGMRICRPHSEEKLSKKKGPEFNFRQYMYEKDL